MAGANASWTLILLKLYKTMIRRLGPSVSAAVSAPLPLQVGENDGDLKKEFWKQIFIMIAEGMV